RLRSIDDHRISSAPHREAPLLLFPGRKRVKPEPLTRGVGTGIGAGEGWEVPVKTRRKASRLLQEPACPNYLKSYRIPRRIQVGPGPWAAGLLLPTSAGEAVKTPLRCSTSPLS